MEIRQTIDSIAPPEGNHTGVPGSRRKLVFLGLGQILITVSEIIDCLETTSEITQVFQGFFSSAKRHANSENQGKDDGNAEHGKVDVEENFEPQGKPGSQSG